MVAGERNRDTYDSRKGIEFRRLRVYETRSLIPLSSIPATDGRCKVRGKPPPHERETLDRSDGEAE